MGRLRLPPMDVIKFMVNAKPRDQDKIESMFDLMNTQFKGDLLRKSQHVASSGRFNVFIVVMVFFNTMLIGVEVDTVRGDDPKDRLVFAAFECFFALVFLVEMCVRINQLGLSYFEDAWNLFDYSLVVLSVTDVGLSISGRRQGSLRVSSTLRIFRLLRVVRSIKGLKALNGLWIIIQGLLDSVKSVFWVALASIVLIYIFGVMMTSVLYPDQHLQSHWLKTDIYIGSVPKSMLTVLQIMTLDSWAMDVARPLMENNAFAVPIILAAIVVLCFGNLNILVAVMVERIGTIARDSKETSSRVIERTEQALLASILEEFHRNDKDASGTLDRMEFKKLLRTPSLSHKISLLGIRVDEAESLFDLMDIDKSGSVTPNEFIIGLQKVKGAAKGQDVVSLICFAQKQYLTAMRSVEKLRCLNDKMDTIQERLNNVGEHLSKELGRRKDEQIRAGSTLTQASRRQLVLYHLKQNQAQTWPPLVAESHSPF